MSARQVLPCQSAGVAMQTQHRAIQRWEPLYGVQSLAEQWITLENKRAAKLQQYEQVQEQQEFDDKAGFEPLLAALRGVGSATGDKQEADTMEVRLLC